MNFRLSDANGHAMPRSPTSGSAVPVLGRVWAGVTTATRIGTSAGGARGGVVAATCFAGAGVGVGIVPVTCFCSETTVSGPITSFETATAGPSK
jgi:hypothetical protein